MGEWAHRQHGEWAEGERAFAQNAGKCLWEMSKSKGLMPNSIRTIQKDHKGHKDRGSFTERNEGNEGEAA
jgi:hypothetical protein